MRKTIAVLAVVTALLLTAGTFSAVGVAHDDANDNDEECEAMMSEMADDCPTAGGGMRGMMTDGVDEDCPMDDNRMMDRMGDNGMPERTSDSGMGCN